MTTQASQAGRVGRLAPRILRLDPNADWRVALSRAAGTGFDTILWHGPAPADAGAETARLGLTALADLRVDRAGTDAPPGLFTTLPRPLLDPREAPALATQSIAVVTGPESAAELARFWGGRIQEWRAQGLAGVRLLGLSSLPAALVPLFLAELRLCCLDAVLFGWTPGLPWDVLQQIAPGTLDAVASSLPWWDGRGEWLWRELDLLRGIAAVVADAGDAAPAPRRTLAALMADGWMTHAPEDGALNALRDRIVPGCPYSRLISPAGDPVIALELTDQPDPRRANRAGIAVLNIGSRAATVAGATLLTRVGGIFETFAAEDGRKLLPDTQLELEPGELVVFATTHAPAPVETPLSKSIATQAAKNPRLAIEAPSPCVDGGRFPARRIVGSLVQVECDILADGHDKLAAALRYRGPGESTWTEVPMRLIGNDRWTAPVPLTRLGMTQYTIEAWKDVWGTYVHELSAKHNAGVPTSLEIKEGIELVAKAAARSKKKLASALNAVLKGAKTEDAQREALLSPELADLMHQADDRPFKVELEQPIPLQAERTAAAFASWYEIFPRSMSDDPNRHGTFRDVVRHLPRIRSMGFDVLYFPPIHPIGRKNRKGRNNTLTPTPEDHGSPYAIGSEEGGHEAIHPELGSLEDFQHLRMAAAEHGIELALDFAIQCSPDHPWLKQHPDWFNWRPDGTIRYAENPPKKYQDIVNVDFYAPGAIPDLWLALCNVVLFWARQGVRLFRVDNPHTKSFPFWEWMIAEVQARYPDTVFLSEAFTRPKVMYRLAKIGFSQSYTYFTWRNTKREFQEYLTELTQGPPAEFFRPHFFVNTPDINPIPLQTSGRPGFLIRAALATTLSGLWGLYNGFELCEATPLGPGKEEYLDSEKYQIRAWDWDRPGNIVAEIAQLNAIRRLNPALQTHLGITFLDCPNDQILAFEKATPDRSNVVLVAISMDYRNPQSGPVAVPFWRYTPEPQALDASDLIGGTHERWWDRHRHVSLTLDRPYAIWRLSPAA
ncbi:MAG TPA: alpha-1,4-glucan--maltose-1-phosphate maltosyltransferase [Acetobacteraceae bacterium]|nr:alpha-1,4-glucan--maltose-1-phosphate maltosyltransferase [Acetobacteraceae bacterium]